MYSSPRYQRSTAEKQTILSKTFLTHPWENKLSLRKQKLDDYLLKRRRHHTPPKVSNLSWWSLCFNIRSDCTAIDTLAKQLTFYSNLSTPEEFELSKHIPYFISILTVNPEITEETVSIFSILSSWSYFDSPWWNATLSKSNVITASANVIQGNPCNTVLKDIALIFGNICCDNIKFRYECIKFNFIHLLIQKLQNKTDDIFLDTKSEIMWCWMQITKNNRLIDSQHQGDMLYYWCINYIASSTRIKEKMFNWYSEFLVYAFQIVLNLVSMNEEYLGKLCIDSAVLLNFASILSDIAIGGSDAMQYKDEITCIVIQIFSHVFTLSLPWNKISKYIESTNILDIIFKIIDSPSTFINSSSSSSVMNSILLFYDNLIESEFKIQNPAPFIYGFLSRIDSNIDLFFIFSKLISSDNKDYINQWDPSSPVYLDALIRNLHFLSNDNSRIPDWMALLHHAEDYLEWVLYKLDNTRTFKIDILTPKLVCLTEELNYIANDKQDNITIVFLIENVLEVWNEIRTGF